MKNIYFLSLTLCTLFFCVPAQSAKAKKSAPKETAAYIEVKNEEQFTNELSKNGIFIIKFHAPTCGACKHMAPHFEKVAKEFKGQATFLSVNASAGDLQDVARLFNISALPTTFIISKKIGALSEEELKKLVQKTLIQK